MGVLTHSNEEDSGLSRTYVERAARAGRLLVQACSWLMLSLMVQTARADRDERLEQLLSLSGIAAVMTSYPQQSCIDPA